MSPAGTVIQVRAGSDDNFAYVIGNSRATALIDPAFEHERLDAAVRGAPGPLRYIINTHAHGDHTALNPVFQAAYNVPIVIHEQGASRIRGRTRTVVDGDVLDLGGETIQILHTPGHTPDSMTLLYGQCLFTGDTLFVDEDCGKLCYEGGLEDLFASLQRLRGLPDELRVYSGHRYGRKDVATLGEEKRTNPALRCDTLEAFRKFKG